MPHPSSPPSWRSSGRERSVEAPPSPPSRERPRSLTILGATGSVGRSTLALVAEDPDAYRVEVVTGGRRVAELAALALSVGARLAVVADEAAYGDLAAALAGTGIEAAAGPAALVEAATRPTDWVMSAIVGAAGLGADHGGARARRHGGARQQGVPGLRGRAGARGRGPPAPMLLPVDSEHNAIFQVLAGSSRGDVERLMLTASGGPFRLAPLDRMAKATPAEAVAHPQLAHGRQDLASIARP